MRLWIFVSTVETADVQFAALGWSKRWCSVSERFGFGSEITQRGVPLQTMSSHFPQVDFSQGGQTSDTDVVEALKTPELVVLLYFR